VQSVSGLDMQIRGAVLRRQRIDDCSLSVCLSVSTVPDPVSRE